MASPLHTTFPESPHGHHCPGLTRDDAAHSPRHPGRPVSPSKQTRRLQLRNAGFRGVNLPSRDLTPRSPPSTSTNWSSASGLPHSSDLENFSPSSGKRAGDEPTSHALHHARQPSSGGILQDIGNANAVNSRQANTKWSRTRTSAGKFWVSSRSDGTLDQSAAHDDAHSSPPFHQASSPRQRPSRLSHTKMSRSRRSVSGETRKYVDHLEQQLSEAQAQLCAMTSPTTTRDQSSKLRHLNAETKQLQEEVAAWEAKYEERVNEEMEKHHQVEASLRARVRSLEEETEMSRYRLRDLEEELEMTKQSTEAVETANVNLEKRLEIMSELLAASPTRIDLHGSTPGRPRQGRPHSMFPRFPMTGPFAASPDRSSSRAHAASPSSSIARYSPGNPMSPTNLTFSPEVGSDDDESGHSDVNSVSIAATTTKRPVRRMRRFGAGSMGPKPLILPATSHFEPVSASAPGFERYEPEGSFPFSHRFEHSEGHDSTRARTMSETFSPSSSPPTTFDPPNERHGPSDHTLGCDSPPSRPSLSTPGRDFSPLGPGTGAAVGRSLMDELTAARSPGELSDPEDTTETQIHIAGSGMIDSSPFSSDVEVKQRPTLQDTSNEKMVSPPEAITARFPSESSTAVATSTAYGTLSLPRPPELVSRSSSTSLGMRPNISLSRLDSLRFIFNNLFCSPVDMARHLVHMAQSRMSIPRPLLTVQWWLVGVLLGPMARRKMLAQLKPCCRVPPPDRRSIHNSASPAVDPSIAYGKAYHTPTSSPGSNSLVAGKGKKRSPSPLSETTSTAPGASSSPCPHHPALFKHHPWLWLRFSMTLALAVGVAFRDGPSSLLQDAACACRKASKRSGGAAGNPGAAAAQWRKAGRERVLVTPGAEGRGGAGA